MPKPRKYLFLSTLYPNYHCTSRDAMLEVTEEELLSTLNEEEIEDEEV